MFRGANEVNAGNNSQEPSVQDDASYYLKFKDASKEQVEKFVGTTEGKPNAQIVEMAKSFEVTKVLEPKEVIKPKKKVKNGR